MSHRFLNILGVLAGLGLSALTFAPPASAADLGLVAAPSAVGHCSEFVFQCENGQQVAICPIELSVYGEVVTAHLKTSHHGSSHVRLVPMGVGYRYAGPGVWFDGLHEEGVLNYGNNTKIGCTMVH